MRKRYGLLAILGLFIVSGGITAAWAQWSQDGVMISHYASDFYRYPQIAADGAGGAIIGWDDIYVRKINGYGFLVWPSIQPDNGFYPKIISDQGEAIIIWYADQSSRWNIYAQKLDANGNALWGPNGIRVADSTFTGGHLQYGLISDGNGGAIIAWQDYRTSTLGAYGIFAQRVDANGNVLWTPKGVPVCSTVSSIKRYPRLVSDGAGGAIVTWEDLRFGGTASFAQRIDATGDAVWTTNGIRVSNMGASLYPEMVSDGAGGAIIVFMGPGVVLYAQRIDPDGTLLWTQDGYALRPGNHSSQRSHQVIQDGYGGAVITWRQVGSLGPDSIYAQRISASGALQWSAQAAVICAAAGSEDYPHLISGENDGAIITWHDNRSGNYDIYAQEIDANGNMLWESDGVAVCSALDDQQYPEIVTDGSGGAIIAWEDQRSGHREVYAQRVDALGNAAPTAVDTPLMPIALHQNYPNPFNPNTTISYQIPVRSMVNLSVFDVSGRLVRTLVSDHQEPGLYATPWDGKDSRGSSVASGIYFYKLQAGNYKETKRMVLLR